MLLGNQHAGIVGSATVVAPTLAYKIEVQDTTPTVMGSALTQASFDGWA